MQNSFRFVLIVASLLIVTGCTTRLVDYTIISTKNVDLTRAASFERGKERVEGKDQISIIIVFPTGVPNVKEAIDRAIESVPGAVALVDGVVTRHSFYIPYIFGQESYVVEGTPLIDPSLAAVELESPYMIVKLNKEGNLQERRYVSAQEYEKVRNKMFGKEKKLN